MRLSADLRHMLACSAPCPRLTLVHFGSKAQGAQRLLGRVWCTVDVDKHQSLAVTTQAWLHVTLTFSDASVGSGQCPQRAWGNALKSRYLSREWPRMNLNTITGNAEGMAVNPSADRMSQTCPDAPSHSWHAF